MGILLTNHARFKLWLLEQHGFRFTEDLVKEAIKHPDFAKDARFNRFSAHKNLNDLTLRVIYEERDNIITVVTVMVVRRGRYGNKI